MVDNKFSFLKKRIIEFVTFVLTSAAIFLAPFIDIVILENSIAEISVTELLQEISLVVITSIFIYLSLRHIEIKYGMILIGGFFSCMLIRELDFITDQIPLLSWFHIVCAVVLFCSFLAVKIKRTRYMG